jgi:hypothetical protein
MMASFYPKIRVLCGLAPVLLLLSCGGHENSTTPVKLPVGFLDAPRNGDTIRGTTTIKGWALSEGGIRQVEIYLDRTFLGNANLQVSRPDLAQFPFPNPDKGGFEYEWNTATIPPGPHEIVAQAHANDGGVRDVGRASVTTAP